jgi:hypothetical protein
MVYHYLWQLLEMIPVMIGTSLISRAPAAAAAGSACAPPSNPERKNHCRRLETPASACLPITLSRISPFDPSIYDPCLLISLHTSCCRTLSPVSAAMQKQKRLALLQR